MGEGGDRTNSGNGGPPSPAKDAAAGGASRGRQPKFRRRAAARPDEVLDAALDLFIENGFAATRVEDIARRAGLSKGAVYLYFPSKEEILTGLVRRAVAPVAADAMRLVAGYDGPVRGAMVMAFKMLATQLRNPRLIAIPRLIMHEVAQFPELARMYREEVIEKARPALVALIEKGVARGELKPVDADLAVRSVVGPIAVHILMAEIFGIVPEGGLQLDRLVTQHLDILFNGLAARPEAGHE